jgi:hypothetical protein
MRAEKRAAPVDARQATIIAVGNAVIEMHKEEMAKRPEWFWHLLLRAEAKATKIAAQASHGPPACGDATFIEVYAKTLPALFAQALERLDEQTGLNLS